MSNAHARHGGGEPLRLVIFDVDGTLVDSQHHIVAAQGLAFAEVGLPAPSRAAALSVVGLSLPEAFRALVGADGPVDALCRAYRDAWTALRRTPGFTEVLYPGAGDTVHAFAARADIRLGIATGKSRPGGGGGGAPPPPPPPRAPPPPPPFHAGPVHDQGGARRGGRRGEGGGDGRRHHL